MSKSRLQSSLCTACTHYCNIKSSIYISRNLSKDRRFYPCYWKHLNSTATNLSITINIHQADREHTSVVKRSSFTKHIHHVCHTFFETTKLANWNLTAQPIQSIEIHSHEHANKITVACSINYGTQWCLQLCIVSGTA